MRIESRFDHDVVTVGSKVEGGVIAAIIQIGRFLDQYSLAGDFVQLRQGFQLVSVVLYLVHHPLRQIVIDPNRDSALPDRRVLQNVERPVRHAVQVHSDVQPFGDQFNVVQILNFDSIVHYQVIHAVLVESDFEFQFFVGLLFQLLIGYLDRIVVHDVHALSSDVPQVAIQSIRSRWPAEEVHSRVVRCLNVVVIDRSRGDVHLHVEDVFWSIFPHALVDSHSGH